MVKKKKGKLKKIVKVQLWITAAVLFLYLAISHFAGQGVLTSDLKSKGQVAGAMITAVVRAFGPPAKPTVVATSDCTVQRTAYVHLEWALDRDSTEYDIYRDGSELMLNLVENSFNDLTVIDDAAYSYYVVAKGPKGTATSDPVTITAEKCPSVANPEVTVETFQGRSIVGRSGVLETYRQVPFFQGQTNIPNAIIELELHSGKAIYATTQANGNGYWQWSPSVSLLYGLHILYVRAIDPLDPSVTAATSFRFRIKERGEKENKEEAELEAAVPVNNRPSTSTEPELPVIQNENRPDFRLEAEEEAYRGEKLEVRVLFAETVKENQEINLKYTLSSLDQKFSVEYNDKVKVDPSREVIKAISLPYSLKLGKYKIQVSATIGATTVSHEQYFILKDRPIVQLGTGYITATDIVSHIGWLLLICLLILLMLVSAAVWEHHLTQRALIQITEKFLKKKGFIS